ncbi:hypothetical protein DPMN_082435 [Dreissena polymorpha]|uniref:Uncharacterized protein n=1 Tax=Dreissena polymorpha TaxID=45954 RepID=A0A9D4BIU5_DREPO|nr:hypothetical protein DPMN_082435 [Dreissena polymorpha]
MKSESSMSRTVGRDQGHRHGDEENAAQTDPHAVFLRKQWEKLYEQRSEENGLNACAKSVFAD